MEPLQFVAQVVIPGTGVAAIVVGGIWSLLTYSRAARTRRAEWLHTLHSEFFDAPTHKSVRRLLDYGPEEELNRLYRGLQDGSEPDLCEPVVDYLNFFEFIGGLRAMKELAPGEIEMLFEYYLRLLLKHPLVREFIRTQGFENLDRILVEIESSPT